MATAQASRSRAGLGVAVPSQATRRQAFGWAAFPTRAGDRALLAAGGRRQIAGHLYRSGNTVRSHLEQIRDKTGDSRRTGLVRYAVQAGIDPVAPPT